MQEKVGKMDDQQKVKKTSWESKYLIKFTEKGVLNGGPKRPFDRENPSWENIRPFSIRSMNVPISIPLYIFDVNKIQFPD